VNLLQRTPIFQICPFMRVFSLPPPTLCLMHGGRQFFSLISQGSTKYGIPRPTTFQVSLGCTLVFPQLNRCRLWLSAAVHTSDPDHKCSPLRRFVRLSHAFRCRRVLFFLTKDYLSRDLFVGEPPGQLLSLLLSFSLPEALRWRICLFWFQKSS